MVMPGALVCGEVEDRPLVCSLHAWRDSVGCRYRDKNVSVSPNEGDKRVPTVQEHNESSNVHEFLYFFCISQKLLR